LRKEWAIGAGGGRCFLTLASGASFFLLLVRQTLALVFVSVCVCVWFCFWWVFCCHCVLFVLAGFTAHRESMIERERERGERKQEWGPQ